MNVKTTNLVFEFAKRVSRVKPLTVILYGSSARDEEDNRSDVDIFIMLDTDSNPESTPGRGEISGIALDLEKKFDRNISLVFSNRGFDGLDDHFLSEVLSDGITLYGKPLVKLHESVLKPYSLVSYSMRKLPVPTKMKVRKELFGYRTVKRLGKKVYTNSDEGLVKRLDGRRLGSGCVLVQKSKVKKLLLVLEKFKVEYAEKDVWTVGR